VCSSDLAFGMELLAAPQAYNGTVY
jgi:hypothetical protein